jgi:hypothetical protein
VAENRSGKLRFFVAHKKTDDAVNPFIGSVVCQLYESPSVIERQSYNVITDVFDILAAEPSTWNGHDARTHLRVVFRVMFRAVVFHIAAVRG